MATDKELRDATDVAYVDLSNGFDNLLNDKMKLPFTIREIIEEFDLKSGVMVSLPVREPLMEFSVNEECFYYQNKSDFLIFGYKSCLHCPNRINYLFTVNQSVFHGIFQFKRWYIV